MAYKSTPAFSYDANLVWAAACAAQRINGEYFKGTKWPDAPVDSKTSNRDLIENILRNDAATIAVVTDEDREQGELVRRFYKALTFKLITGNKLSDFDNTALALSNVDTITTKYELAVIASLPSCYVRGAARNTVENRVKFAAGGYIGQYGDKVKLNVEVLRSFFSQQWATHYVTAITADDQAIFFSFKNDPPAVGSKVTVAGTIKSHKDNQTQLNRVKVL
jgi:hypothetical protein